MSFPIEKKQKPSTPMFRQSPQPYFKFQKKDQSSNISSIMKLTQPMTTTNKSKLDIPITSNLQMNYSRRNDNNQNKRLKLKDYLHLNSIQKKNKKEFSSSKFQPQKSILLSQDQISMTQSRHQTSKSQLCKQSTAIFTQTSKISSDSNQRLKQQICKRIQDQIKKLGDLCEYLQNDFQSKDSEAQTQVFLFKTLNTIATSSKGLNEVAQNIIDYERPKEGSKQLKKTDYFWNKNYKQLQSPARILKKSLEMTYNLASLLQSKK